MYALNVDMLASTSKTFESGQGVQPRVKSRFENTHKFVASKKETLSQCVVYVVFVDKRKIVVIVVGSAVWTRIGRRSTNRLRGERCCRTNLRDRRCESCFIVIIFLDSQSYILCSIGALTNFFSFFYTQHAADRNGITRATRPVGRFLSRAKEKQRGWWRRGRGGRSLRRIYGEK